MPIGKTDVANVISEEWVEIMVIFISKIKLCFKHGYCLTYSGNSSKTQVPLLIILIFHFLVWSGLTPTPSSSKPLIKKYNFSLETLSLHNALMYSRVRNDILHFFHLQLQNPNPYQQKQQQKDGTVLAVPKAQRVGSAAAAIWSAAADRSRLDVTLVGPQRRGVSCWAPRHPAAQHAVSESGEIEKKYCG